MGNNRPRGGNIRARRRPRRRQGNAGVVESMDHAESVRTLASHVVSSLFQAYMVARIQRRKFVFHGYYNGVKHFIDAYYVMIHRAAGWNALRMFLLVCDRSRTEHYGIVDLLSLDVES